MLTGYVLRPRARRDLADIWSVSARTLGPEQADAHLRQIQGVLTMLAGNPRLGRACDDIRPGYRRFPSGAHLVFYRTDGVAIDVVRALRQRTDPSGRL